MYMTYNIYSRVIGSTSMNILLLVLYRCVAFFGNTKVQKYKIVISGYFMQ